MYTKDTDSAETDEKVTNWANWRIRRVTVLGWMQWPSRFGQPDNSSTHSMN